MEAQIALAALLASETENPADLARGLLREFQNSVPAEIVRGMQFCDYAIKRRVHQENDPDKQAELRARARRLVQSEALLVEWMETRKARQAS